MVIILIVVELLLSLLLRLLFLLCCMILMINCIHLLHIVDLTFFQVRVLFLEGFLLSFDDFLLVC